MNARRLEGQRLEGQRLEGQRLEGQRLEGQRLEGQRLEAPAIHAPDARISAGRRRARALPGDRPGAQRWRAPLLSLAMCALLICASAGAGVCAAALAGPVAASAALAGPASTGSSRSGGSETNSLESAAAKASSTGRAVAMSLIGLAFAIAAIVLAFRRDFREAVGVFAVGIVAVLLATPTGVSVLQDTVNSLFGSR